MVNEKRNNTGRSRNTVQWVLLPLMLLLLVGISSIAGLVLYSSQTIDNAKRDDLKNRVAIAFEIEAEGLDQLVEEYTYWEEGYQQLIVTPSLVFAEENLGPWMAEIRNIDISLAVNSDGIQTIGHLDGQLHTFDLDALNDAGVNHAINEEQRKNDLAHGVTGLLDYRGDVFQFVLNQFYAETKIVEGRQEDISDGSYLLLARRIDQDFINNLSTRFRLNELRLIDDLTLADNMHVKLLAKSDKVLATLSWKDPANSDLIGMTEILILLFVLGSMAMLALFIARRDISDQYYYQQMLTDMAFKDSLTGVSNRRDFVEKAQAETTRCDRFNHTMSILMLDIDEFKAVNDIHGHNEGDKVLIEFARCMADAMREHDVFARIGGEEFAVLMPHSDLVDALQAAERLRSYVEKMKNQDALSICTSITVSIGVAERLRGEGLTSLMVRADKALYAAKQNGRNRCEIAESTVARKWKHLTCGVD